MVDESANSLATCAEGSNQSFVAQKWGVRDPSALLFFFFFAYLCDAPDVLVAVLLREAQILVQAEPHIVAVQPVRGQSQVQQMLLQRRRHRRLARGGQAREPDGEPALAAQRVALVARERRVPGDVAKSSTESVSYALRASRHGIFPCKTPPGRAHSLVNASSGLRRWRGSGVAKKEKKGKKKNIASFAGVFQWKFFWFEVDRGTRERENSTNVAIGYPSCPREVISARLLDLYRVRLQRERMFLAEVLWRQVMAVNGSPYHKSAPSGP